jgi:hypothetical protein
MDAVATANQRRRMLPVALLAAGLLVAGCGSQQASPLSVAKTKQAFSAAGIHLRLPRVREFGRSGGHPPVALLIWGSGYAQFPSVVLVYRDVADAVRAREVPTNPSLTVRRIQNVVILAGPQIKRDQRLQVAIRHL